MTKRGADTPSSTPKGGLRPPWRPGESGNPAGRPKGARNRATMAAEQMLDGEAAALTRKAIDLALEGDAAALRLCLERILPARKGRRLSLDLPAPDGPGGVAAAALALLGAVAAGDLSGEEASAIAPVIESARRAIETEELERRLAALEQGREGHR